MSRKIKYTDEPMEAKVIPDFLPPPGQLRKSENAPRLVYTQRGDRLRMRFSGRPVKRRVKALGGVVLEYDAAQTLVSIVFTEASKRFSDSDHAVSARQSRSSPPRGQG